MRLFKFKEIRGKKGIALIMALWIMTILLVVAASFAFMMRTEVKMAKNYRDGMKAHYLALAGVEHAIAVILNDTGNTDHYGEAWHTTFRTNWNESAVTWNALPISFGGGTYAVHLSDENSKYNLNYPSRSGLQYLVTTDHPPGDPPVSYRHKICGLKDYIDSGDGGDIQDWSPTDPDRGYEEGAGVKNNKFDTVYEIQKVRGKSSAWG
ncbi:type II secretion system protein GspK, partial [bacterium]|nr:type II secretion system protein GspK [bacterium]